MAQLDPLLKALVDRKAQELVLTDGQRPALRYGQELRENTIRKYLRLGAVEVRFKVSERPSRLDPFADKLSEWLRVEAGKGRKGRRTVRRIHAVLAEAP